MTAPDSRDSVERVVAEMREHAADLLASAEAIDASDLADKFTATAAEFRKAATEETDRATRLQAIARGPQQAGGEDDLVGLLRGRAAGGDKLLESSADALQALQAEVARLRERTLEMERQRDDYLNREWVASKAKQAAEAALREAGRDAERFGVVIRSPDFQWNGRRWPMLDHDELRAAIDAALNGGQDDAT